MRVEQTPALPGVLNKILNSGFKIVVLCCYSPVKLHLRPMCVLWGFF